MPRTNLVGCVLAASLAAGCAAPRSSAPSSSASAPLAQAAPAQSQPQLICRMERPTGSNIPQRVCRTQEEIDAMSLSAQDAIRKATQSNVQTKQQ